MTRTHGAIRTTHQSVMASGNGKQHLGGDRADAARRLEAYRQTPEYLQEPWRPGFHFTPEMNWMNDPNGLVFHNGEYHLFYQHNPFGNEWGHMSWGHAVSKDLIRWEHLPVALWEEDGESIYSGSCVVDHENLSGLAVGSTPAVVAVYTSERPCWQTQALAFSTDNGRTWAKYHGNPVLDLGASDFRDPRVFWHQATEAWVMAVALAKEGLIQFYRSQDLREWELASAFGPAGIRGKSSWECPELVELPVEDRLGNPTGKTRWLLKADADTNAFAGGSGGEYFVGEFDGFKFSCKHDPFESLTLDYGRDFFAAQAWSGVVDESGRPVWAGWLNNWETPNLPTSPWRGGLSVPRNLALRHTDSGLGLVQRPIGALKQLRGERIDGRIREVRGTMLDIVLVITPHSDELIELRILKGAGEEAVIGYHPTRSELYFDRRRSGEIGFHEAFPGVYAAPLHLKGEPLRLRLLIDRSSVEVFANDGLVVSTNRVFPSLGSDGVELSAPHATVNRFDVWPMESQRGGNDC